MSIVRDSRHNYALKYPKDEQHDAIEAVYEANVTGVTDEARKPALEFWNRNEVAKAAVRNASIVSAMVEKTPVQEGLEDKHPAYAFLRQVPGYKKDAAAENGTAIHAIGEALARGQKPDVPTDGIVRDLAVNFFRGFVERYNPRFHPLYIEYMVASIEHEYAGTADMAVQIGPDIWCLDIKSSSKPITEDARGFPYSDTALQLAALYWADFMGRSDDDRKYPIPGRLRGPDASPTRFGVVAVTPEDCQLIEYNVTPADFAAFLNLRGMWEWTRKRKPEVKGRALPAPVEEKAA